MSYKEIPKGVFMGLKIVSVVAMLIVSGAAFGRSDLKGDHGLSENYRARIENIGVAAPSESAPNEISIHVQINRMNNAELRLLVETLEKLTKDIRARIDGEKSEKSPSK